MEKGRNTQRDRAICQVVRWFPTFVVSGPTVLFSQNNGPSHSNKFYLTFNDFQFSLTLKNTPRPSSSPGYKGLSLQLETFELACQTHSMFCQACFACFLVSNINNKQSTLWRASEMYYHLCEIISGPYFKLKLKYECKKNI
jgi:hypothetical protein